ncbi:hypothetical protein BDY17DRAFT_303272 [Neohortaea acidophila]|uniref:Amidohydrolase-related domain-containing protein n=1 Tax=Neohortaea acidophila TaxID=245834 RepID=A0A6A6PLI8_9PEZI|nr:uncharacterized protein BDY17DRAFT_303272 [Neohortaea acidophila]KAF2480127.1 hypothetical protein BDY17DRAFT_303272 [Neohortaea acidophila]
MAAEFLRTHGIDLDAELARMQQGGNADPTRDRDMETVISNVSLPKTRLGTRWTVFISHGRIARITLHTDKLMRTLPTTASIIHGRGALLAPSLCHPHIHIDKAFLLSYPKYSDLQIQSGDFNEAMVLTGKAKAQFTADDLLERGQRVVDESVEAGVSHMRAFVEVDAVVGNACLDAGVELKRKAETEGRCHVQLCAFAQLALFSASDGDEDGAIIRRLMEQAAGREEVDVLGSTPYVESDRKKTQRNVRWLVELSIKSKKHVDFHLDYHLDANVEPVVWYVIKTLKEMGWKEKNQGKTVVLGHCTRLTRFDGQDWTRLREEIGDLPISFVGLPTSDLFMMRTPEKARGTLNVPELIQQHGLNACLGINNIGNAFTPYGSCDPLALACHGVGIYHAGTQQDAEVLYECVSNRAKAAIGVGSDRESLEFREGSWADLLLFASEQPEWRTRKSVADSIYLYDRCHGRVSIVRGRRVQG